MILCIGPSGAGKTVLLRKLKQLNNETLKNQGHGSSGVQKIFNSVLCKTSPNNLEIIEDESNEEASNKLLGLGPDPHQTGIDLVEFYRITGKRNNTKEIVIVREIGGVMKRYWTGLLCKDRSRAILYVVDGQQQAEGIAAVVLDLNNFIQENQKWLKDVEIVIVLNKVRSKDESSETIKSMLRLERIEDKVKSIKVMIIDVRETTKMRELLDWCLKFASMNNK